MAAIDLNGLINALSNVAAQPGAWRVFSNHISQSDLMIAIGDIDGMTMANAGSIVPIVKSLHGFPVQAAAYLDAAVQAANQNNQGAFMQNVTEAKVALAQASQSHFGALFSGG